MSATPTPDQSLIGAEIDTALVAALARVRARSEAEIAVSWSKDRDVAIASVEAEAVVIFVEDTLRVENLCEVADLGRAQRTSPCLPRGAPSTAPRGHGWGDPVIPITGDTIDGAWMAALGSLLDDELAPGGKATHLTVAFPADATNEGVRDTVDRFLSEAAQQKPSAGLTPIDTVANTLFPSAFYLPDHAEAPRQHLYDMHEAKMTFHRRRRGPEKETYFSRMTGTDGTGERGQNQLEALVARMRHELTLKGPKSSAYEVGLSEVVGRLRVQSPEARSFRDGLPVPEPRQRDIGPARREPDRSVPQSALHQEGAGKLCRSRAPVRIYRN